MPQQASSMRSRIGVHENLLIATRQMHYIGLVWLGSYTAARPFHIFGLNRYGVTL